jgi:YqjK-like protein
MPRSPPSSHARQQDLTERRQALLQRSALLRFELAEQGKSLQESLTLVDQTYAGWQWLKAHPQWPVGTLLLLLAGRPKRILKWLPKLWWSWGLLKKARRWLAV